MVKQEEGWVVCRAFKKRTTVPTKRRQLWDPNCFLYDDATLLEPLDKNVLIKRAKHNTDDLAFTPFKQELPFEANQIIDDNGLFGSMYLKSIGDDELSQLPQLESPSLASDKLPETISCTGEDDVGAEKKITDWRALDKFVASQFLMSGEE